jgi:acyl-CoA-binding protein
VGWWGEPGDGSPGSEELAGLIGGAYRTLADSSTGKRPGIFHFEARHKHDAWARTATAFGGRPDDAKARYVEVARRAGWKGPDAPPSPEVEAEAPKKSGGMGFGPSVSVMAREDEGEG